MEENFALLRLLQLASPALPVGAYSYSEGLEWLVEQGKITSSASLEHWLAQELQFGAVRLEAAIVVRGYEAAASGEVDRLLGWNRWLSAARETEELRLQSWQMGRSLLRLLVDLHPELASTCTPLLDENSCNFAIAFAIAAAHWQIPLESALVGYLHSWTANLVNAGIKLIPLGQTAGQQLLLTMQPIVDGAAQEILHLPDAALETCGWGLALASMAHEIQYSRLFRS